MNIKILYLIPLIPFFGIGLTIIDFTVSSYNKIEKNGFPEQGVGRDLLNDWARNGFILAGSFIVIGIVITSVLFLTHSSRLVVNDRRTD